MALGRGAVGGGGRLRGGAGNFFQKVWPGAVRFSVPDTLWVKWGVGGQASGASGGQPLPLRWPLRPPLKGGLAVSQ